MKAATRYRPRVMWATTTAAALLALVGIAYATIPDPGGVIHGCYTNKTGALNVIDSATQSCARGQTALNWNQTGPPGPAGPSDIYRPASQFAGPAVAPGSFGLVSQFGAGELPAGPYMFLATITAVNGEPSNTASGGCSVGLNSIDGAVTFTIPPGGAVPLTVAAPLAVPANAGAAVKFTCENTSATSTITFNAGTTTATATGTLH